MKKIFVSYSHENQDWVASDGKYGLISWLARQLKQKGIEIWTDHTLKKLPGEEYNILIAKEIEESDMAIMLLSQDFVSSEYIMEKEVPLIKEKCEKGEIKILPILLTRISDSDKKKFAWIFDYQIYPNATTPLIKVVNIPEEWSDAKVDILDGILYRLNNSSPDDDNSHPNNDEAKRKKKNISTLLKNKNVRWVAPALAAIICVILYFFISFAPYNKDRKMYDSLMTVMSQEPREDSLSMFLDYAKDASVIEAKYSGSVYKSSFNKKADSYFKSFSDKIDSCFMFHKKQSDWSWERYSEGDYFEKDNCVDEINKALRLKNDDEMLSRLKILNSK